MDQLHQIPQAQKLLKDQAALRQVLSNPEGPGTTSENRYQPAPGRGPGRAEGGRLRPERHPAETLSGPRGRQGHERAEQKTLQVTHPSALERRDSLG